LVKPPFHGQLGDTYFLHECHRQNLKVIFAYTLTWMEDVVRRRIYTVRFEEEKDDISRRIDGKAGCVIAVCSLCGKKYCTYIFKVYRPKMGNALVALDSGKHPVAVAKTVRGITVMVKKVAIDYLCHEARNILKAGT